MTLLNELRNNPRYPVRLGFLGGYMLGAPWRHKDRKRSLLDMATHVRRTIDVEMKSASESEKDWATTVRLTAMLDDLLNRITAKSVGLMQALSILAAILTIVITQAGSTNELQQGFAGGVFSYPTLALTLFTTLLLFANAGLATRRQPDFFTNPKLLIENTYAIVLARAHRLRRAQWLAFACFLAVFAATISLALNEIAEWFGLSWRIGIH